MILVINCSRSVSQHKPKLFVSNTKPKVFWTPKISPPDPTVRGYDAVTPFIVCDCVSVKAVNSSNPLCDAELEISLCNWVQS